MRLLPALIAVAAFAHGPIHEQIQMVTAQIAKEPRNARLYLKRGELRRVHSELNAAIADYDRASSLDPALVDVDLCRGRLWLQQEQPKQAIMHLDRFLAAKPNDEEALATRAAARLMAGDARGAADDYSRAIEAGGPKVDHYLGRARAHASIDVGQALAGIDQAIERLGPLVTLEELAIELEQKRGNIDAMLARLDRIAAQSPRKELYLVRRGEFLRDAGRGAEAAAAFEQAQQAIAALPPGIRQTRAVADLERRASIR